jgi:hypothetical protein
MSGQKSSPDSGLGFRIVCRRGLLGIEGFAVRVRFDPDSFSDDEDGLAVTYKRAFQNGGT